MAKSDPNTVEITWQTTHNGHLFKYLINLKLKEIGGRFLIDDIHVDDSDHLEM